MDKKKITWIICFWFFQNCLFSVLSDPAIKEESLKRVLKDFIMIRGMKMKKYNSWWSQVSFEECANKCVQSPKIRCKSFSYSVGAEICSIYENDRYTASPDVYICATAPYHRFRHQWNYFERKSGPYRDLESQIDRLLNLTEIDVEEASSVLNSVANIINPGHNSTSGDKEQSGVLPSELELAGKSLLLVMGLNPIKKAPVESVKEFTDVVANVSSVLTNPAYAMAWKAAQKDPSSPGSSAIVTSAEKLTTEVSQKLLKERIAENGISSEADSVAFWMDFEHAVPNYKAMPKQGFSASSRISHYQQTSFQDQIKNVAPPYIFPKPKMKNAFNMKKISQLKAPESTKEISSDYQFQDFIILPREALGNESIVTNVRYKNLEMTMPTRCNDNFETKSFKVPSRRMNIVASSVLTTSIYPRPPKSVFEKNPVIIVFKNERLPKAKNNTDQHDNATVSATTTSPTNSTPAPVREVERKEEVKCVYWQESESGNEGGAWSTKGCLVMRSNETHTVCNCTHLTSFAVLLQIVEYDTENDLAKIHLQVLSIISNIGCILSLLGVTVMCGAFVKLKFHTENMKIHFNLGVAVGLADLIFLFEELAEESRPSCVVVTVLLYYFNMTVLAWMLIEGVHLYSQVVVVFVSARRRFKYYVVAGWGVPVILLTVSMSILNGQLGMHGVCWLSPADKSIWAFAAPALAVILVNTVILITVVKVIVSIPPEKSNHMKVSKLRNAVKGSIFLFPLLGTTWLFGLLSLSQETLLFQYVFAITNSLQGFLLFVFHCLCNSEVREDARRHKWFRTSKSTTSWGSPSFYNNSLGFNVANGLRRFRNSISFELPSSSSGESEEQEVDNDNNKTIRKIVNLFPKVFTSKLPATITEEVEEDTNKYEISNKSLKDHDISCQSVKEPRNSFESYMNALRLFSLPGMPIKHESTIDTTGENNPLPVEDQLILDQMLAKHIATTTAFESASVRTLSKDSLKDALNEKEEKMKMSYDSGLNSIDNESILDEDDEIWMANQQQIVEARGVSQRYAVYIGVQPLM